MGKCLSCCQDSERPMRNGHAGSSTTPTKTTTTSQVTLASAATMRQRHSDRVESVPLTSHSNGAGDFSGDRKTQQHAASKLPPQRKSSNNEMKRLSLQAAVTKGGGGGGGVGGGGDVSEAKIQSLFAQYKDAAEDAILAEGIEKLCEDLAVRPEELKVLVLAWNCDAQTMCRFTSQEFTHGCLKLRVHSIRGIQAKFPDMLEQVKDKQCFKELYRWTYKFGLDSDVGQRTLPIDMAISLWRLVFLQSEPQILQKWLDFLEDHPHIRGIPKDTWDMFLNFIDAVGDDLSSYDDTEAWPSLFDDFVEYENDRQNQNLINPHKTDKDYNYN